MEAVSRHPAYLILLFVKSYRKTGPVSAFLPITIMIALTGYLTGADFILGPLREALPMPFSTSAPRLLGGRLSLDFANAAPSSAALSWAHLIRFLESARVVSAERSEEHTSELQSRSDLVCRLLLEKKKKKCRLTLQYSNTSKAL